MDTKLTEEERKKIYDMLADNILSEIQRKYFGKEKQKLIGKQLLVSVDKAQTTKDMVQFLQSFTKKYPLFRPTLMILSEGEQKEKEQHVINKLESYFKNYAKAN